MTMRGTVWSNVIGALVFSLSSAGAGAAPFWDNAKFKCVDGGKGRVQAKLRGAKFGKQMKTCREDPPSFTALGASGEPTSCKRRPTGGIWGEWIINDDARCGTGGDESDLFWDKAIHKCIAPGKGRVKARLRGTKFGSRKSTCEATSLPEETLGASGQPDYCKTQMTGSMYGYWEIDDDVRCLPTWGKLKKKGCMVPDMENGGTGNRQVYRAKLKKLKRHIEQTQLEWENGKWVPFYESRAYKVQQCLATPGPGTEEGSPGRGTPDFCKMKAGVWGYWYQDSERCEEPLEWGKIKDKGCVRDMKVPDISVDGDVDTSGKRSYHAKLKKVGGNWIDACRLSPLEETTKDGVDLNFEFPTGCLIKDATGIVGTAFGVGLGAVGAAGGSVFGPIGTVGGAAAFGGAGSAASSWIISKWDTSTSVQGVFWKDDASCGSVPQYAAVDNSGMVLLGTGEISTRVTGSAPRPAPKPPAATPPPPPPASRPPTPETGTPPAVRLAWGKWNPAGCTANGRNWTSVLRNVPSGMNWKDACRSAIQLPYLLGEYPRALRNRLNSADPAIGYPDNCRLDRSAPGGGKVVGQYVITDHGCP